MPTDDKVLVARNQSVDDNTNTRDQRRVGIWFLVVTFLMVMGLMSLGKTHAPGVTAEPQDMSGTDANGPTDVNPSNFDVNKPVGAVEWPGLVGQKTKYLTGNGNSPAEPGAAPAVGVSAGVTPDSATDEASRHKSTSGVVPSDAMPPPAAEHETHPGQGNASVTGH